MPDDANAPTASWIQSEDEARSLGARISDPEREGLVVALTTAKDADGPLVDARVLAAELGARGEVYVLTEPAHAWALTEALPDRLDVYGGAVRAWQPIPEGHEPFPNEHPQWMVFNEAEAARVPGLVVAFAEALAQGLPEFATHTRGTVTAVRKAGAMLELETGHAAFAGSDHILPYGEVQHAAEVLSPGMEVEVRIGPWNAQAGRLSVSLRDGAPDPWERLAEVHHEGDVVDGVVSGVRDFGAFVELLPGVEGLLHRSKIVDAYVEDPGDYVQPGDRVAVRLRSIEPGRRKAEVSMIDVESISEAAPPMAVFPGGPPWLPEHPDAYAEMEAAAEAAERGAAE